MLRYIIKRVLSAIFVLFVIVTLVFFLVRLIPGDPLAGAVAKNLPEQIKANFYAKYGLDKPLYIQYFNYMKSLLHFDFGVSLVSSGRSINDLIFNSIPATGKINLFSMLFGVTLGIILGIVAALNRNKWPDHLVMFIAVLGVSMPSFVLAMLLQYVFTIKYPIFPTIGYAKGFGWDSMKYVVLPALALGLYSIATYARYLRSSILEVLNQDYILTARSKGVSGFQLFKNHIIRNASLPIITLLGTQIAFIFSGSFVIESIFGIPGFGQIYVGAVSNRDYTLILGQTVFFAFFYILSLLLIDILYGLVDPRIRIFKQG
jgi:oligopeptide transport system permease protein